ncbi:MAG TPA: AAA family ATPase [Bacilli bacterium]|nr:AAA family ATPase [Bacilli bacterium]
MRIFLRDFKIQGVKNLKAPIELTFANKEVKSFDELDNNVKAIYGPNGSGKTAIIYALSTLKYVLMNPNFLQDSQTLRTLATLLNKESESIDFHLNFFAEVSKGKILLYTYETQIKYAQGRFFLNREKYSYRAHEYAKENILLKTEHGKIVEQFPNEVTDREFLNLLDKSSFLSLLGERVFVHEDVSGLEEFVPLIAPFFTFAERLLAILDTRDTKFTLFFRKREEHLKEAHMFSDIITSAASLHEDRFNFRRIHRDELALYKQTLKQKEAFLKIFKPNIKRLSYEKKLVLARGDNEYYDVNEYIEYEHYKIDLELESVGIKKIYDLFDVLKRLNNGAILALDELDTHINDVYLVKLIEYVMKYAKGQLIFTTHNASPMDLLKTKKNALDFLSISGTLTPWTQIGNYSPANVYHRGMIKKLPFNVTAESFIGVFTSDAK